MRVSRGHESYVQHSEIEMELVNIIFGLCFLDFYYFLYLCLISNKNMESIFLEMENLFIVKLGLAHRDNRHFCLFQWHRKLSNYY